MLNPNLDINTLSRLFKNDDRLVIKNFLQHEAAERIHNACKKDVPFSTHYVIENEYQSKTIAEMSKMTSQEGQSINSKISTAASKGIGFLYEGYLQSRIQLTSDNLVSEELNFLHKVFDFMNSSEVLNLVKEITGNNDITAAEPQYTRFTPGHFLTRHIDVVPGRGRRFAFVLGMTKGWHPDWGGLLQFYAKSGTPRDAWTPKFNVLSIFAVKHVHSVTYVTPYALEPRLSLTGWFVAKK